MSDDRPEMSRRDTLALYGGITGMVLGGGAWTLGLVDTDRLAEESKAVAEDLRALPGLGYEGTSVPLAERVGGRVLLPAETDEPGFWKGAPSMEVDPVGDRVLLHVRHRRKATRGYRVSIYDFDPVAWTLTELARIDKDELGAKSMEGGEIIAEDGEYRWFVSYQSEAGSDWRIREFRGSTVSELPTEGADLNIESEYFHHKDPVYLDGHLHTASISKNWLEHGVERIDIDESRPVATEIETEVPGTARLTSGFVLENEVFADVVPFVPHTDLPNLLWISDERSFTGSLTDGTVRLDTSRHFVSSSRSSVTYVDAETIGNEVYLLWQEERADGSNDLVGAGLSLREYRDLF